MCSTSFAAKTLPLPCVFHILRIEGISSINRAALQLAAEARGRVPPKDEHGFTGMFKTIGGALARSVPASCCYDLAESKRLSVGPVDVVVEAPSLFPGGLLTTAPGSQLHLELRFTMDWR